MAKPAGRPAASCNGVRGPHEGDDVMTPLCMGREVITASCMGEGGR